MEVTSSTIPTTSVANSEVPRWHSSFSVSHGNQHDGMENAASAAGSSSHGGSPLNPVPNFDDERAAYESKSNFELLRAAAVFRLSKIPVLVNNAESLLIASRKILGGTLTDFGLKATLFGHFCAGEDELKIRPVLKKLDEVGIGSILDYAAENDGSPEASKVQGIEPAPGSLRRVREYDYEDEAKCDGHVEVFKKCINDVASLGSDKDGFAAIKVTALGNPKLLARMSTAIVEASRLFEQFDHNKDGTVGRDEFETGYK
jgi:proline dehydrogenase